MQKEELVNIVESAIASFFTAKDKGETVVSRQMDESQISAKKLASYIDHTFLRPAASKKEIQLLCDEAKEYQFYSVCVPPSYVRFAKDLLVSTQIKIGTVVGFPLGYATTATKVFETKEAVSNGADEIDMVIHIGKLKEKDYLYVYQDIAEVVSACSSRICKVIIETCYLTEEEKIAACVLAQVAKANFVKTSTGFGSAGATKEDVMVMRAVVGQSMGIKAAGGIRELKQAIELINAGATRLGTSASVNIIKELMQKN